MIGGLKLLEDPGVCVIFDSTTTDTPKNYMCRWKRCFYYAISASSRCLWKGGSRKIDNTATARPILVIPWYQEGNDSRPVHI